MNQKSRNIGAKRPVQPKREAVLDAALALFAEGGVDGVPVPAIATRAGVGTGTIYRYFASKEVLVNALFQREKATLGRRLTEELDTRMEPRTVFNEFWRRLVTFAQNAPASFRFLELQDHLPYLDADSLAGERDVLDPISQAYRRLQEQGVCSQEPRAEVAMALIWGAFVQLFKAERAGYITLHETDIQHARDACWRLCRAPGSDQGTP